jgi:hypothetical protein
MADECAPEIWQRQFPSMLRFDATSCVEPDAMSGISQV